MDGPHLRSPEDELAALRSTLDLVRAGRPQVILIEGPAGIGKTALVDHFVGLQEDLQVLRSSDRAVAAELFVSIKAVQFRLTHIYSKLELSSRAELVARLRDDGEIGERASGRG